MSQSSKGNLKDFDWKLKLALESNKVSALNSPIIELTLHTEIDSVSVEMDSHRLDSVIHKIREALLKATEDITN
ncbi:putative COMM domain-containing protein 8-like [Daphnia sinensis]|uniref:COMM domain-containing protein 8-like n=1 Tax=Daphnia sinensis TaxID=1820382 RepID=A0AAD5LHG8_9CRUS|nr:putative COMM domain-containing protein 8-like [Daphnia sinensis]